VAASQPSKTTPGLVEDSASPLFNPLGRSFVLDPVSTYKRLHDEAPILQTPLGGWVLTRHADALTVLEHPETSHDPRNSDVFRMMESQNPYGQEFERRRSFLFMDPPDHTRLRGLVSKAFTRRVIESLRPRIQQLVDELIDGVHETGSMEVIEDLAYPVPVIIISELLGVPSEDGAVFREWSRELARGLDPEPMIPPDVVQRRIKAATAFREYFTKLIEERRKDPKDDLLSALITAREEGDKLTNDELLSTLILLLIAGHETTVNLIGNGVLSLLRNPDEFYRLQKEPSLARQAVEETLRYDPPVMFTGRVAMGDISLDGMTINKGAQVIVLIGAANRDETVFNDPHRFDITRTPNPHLAFGMGIHFCLGAPLARVEGEIALATVARRLPSMKLESDQLEYRENIVLRGLAALPVTF
jgi:cytochrome P450